MKAINYNHSYSSKLTQEEELERLFGELLYEVDESGGYETDETRIFKKGNKYAWLQASGCSCWVGDHEGWEMTKTELKKYVTKLAKDGYGSEKTAATWAVGYLK